LPLVAPVLDVQDNAGRYLELMRVDKKAEAGDIRFVLIHSQGNATLGPADEAIVRQVIAQSCR
ncbi:MAG: 3-dehydroquinate synthase, partial [Burkholderiales bacterium PBB4]